MTKTQQVIVHEMTNGTCRTCHETGEFIETHNENSKHFKSHTEPRVSLDSLPWFQGFPG